MENSSPLILEISSDEEAGFGCTTRKGVGGGEFVDKEDCDWLSKLLGEVGGDRVDDSDDVVFVSEVLPRPRKKPPAKGVADEGDDDDCVVLDGDPDKPVVMFNGKAATDDRDDDSDDLEIVGEKGEVACRDFPHPRHLCVKFPFASTPHEVHCVQCHCHVCDSVSPCSHWGTGVSSIDHCHANDKDEYWKAERKRKKKSDKLVPGIRSATGPLDAFIQTIRVPAIAPPQPNYLLQNQVLNPIHPCSITPSVGVPNAVNQGRIHPSRRVLPNYKPRPELASPQLHATCSDNVASRDKRDNSGNRSAQSLRPRAVFKRPGFVGAPPNINHAYRSHLSRDATLKICRASQTPMLNEHHCSNQRNVRSRTVQSVLPQPRLSSPQTMDVSRSSYLPSRSHIPSRPLPRSLIRDPIHCQSQMPSQPYVSSNFVSEVPLQLQTASQPSGENFESFIPPQPHVFQPSIPVPSQKVGAYQPDAGNAFYDQLHSRPMVSSHPDVGNNFENQSPQPEAHSNITSLFIDGRYDLQQGNHPQSGIDESPPDFGSAFDSPLHEVSQCQNIAPADNSQQLGTGNSHHQSIAPVDNFHQESVLLADNSSVIDGNDNQFPGSMEPDSLDFQFDSWMFENHSLPGAFEIPLSPVWNAFSPEPASTDAGTLFDI